MCNGHLPGCEEFWVPTGGSHYHEDDLSDYLAGVDGTIPEVLVSAFVISALLGGRRTHIEQRRRDNRRGNAAILPEACRLRPQRLGMEHCDASRAVRLSGEGTGDVWNQEPETRASLLIT